MGLLSLLRKRKVKANSFKEFIRLLSELGCKEVAAGMEISEPAGGLFGPTSYTLGNIGHFKYYISYESQSEDGTKVEFEENCGQWWGSQYGFADSHDRSQRALGVLFTADHRLKDIKTRLPHLSTVLVARGQPMEEYELEDMREQAKSHGIEPLPL